MILPENDYQILKLTNQFYRNYPYSLYPEILEKRNRAYNCLLFQTHYNYFICIPYRSEINHKNAFRFKSTSRSKIHNSGLDYSKLVIITNSTYIDSNDAIIDKDEFKETIRHLEKIKRESLKYVEDYISHIKGISLLHPKEFQRRYQYSTLKYFHEELNISD